MEQEFGNLCARVARLEAQNARWRRLVATTLIVGGMTIVSMAASQQQPRQQPRHAPGKQTSSVQGVVEAREFRVVNEHDKVKAQLGYCGDGRPFFALFDDDDLETLLLRVTPKGNPQIFLNRGNSPIANVGRYDDTGLSHVETYHPDGERIVVISGKVGSGDGVIWRRTGDSLSEVK